MRFEEIGETTTISFTMDGLHTMALICKVAVECGECCPEAEGYLAAFTAAALIAYTHGDMGKGMREHLAAIHQRIKDGAR